MTQYIFYSTSHCHLCEQAEFLLANLAEKYDIQWQIVEISENNQLLELYGLRIPVVKHPNKDKELGWPFSQQELETFISDNPL